MPWPVYSERFLLVNNPGTWSYWWVPSGKRAIIRGICAMSGEPSGGNAQISIGTIAVWAIDFPAEITGINQEGMIVIYQGQRLGGYTSRGTMSLTLSGYLLEDNTGATGPPYAGVQLPELPDPPTPGPAPR